MTFEATLALAKDSRGSLPVEKGCEYAERAKKYADANDGEQMFALIFEIWETARKANQPSKGLPEGNHEGN